MWIFQSPKVYGAGQWRYSYRGREMVEHGGNNPGYKTQVARFPNDNLAIVAMSNDAQGGFLMESAKWRIIDDVLFKDQETIDWNDRYEELWTNYTRDSQRLTPRPSPPKLPSSPIELLAQRTFEHPTYGSFQPCLVPTSFSWNYNTSDHEQSAECAILLESLAVRRILEGTNLTIPTLIAPWKRTFATHLRIQHFDANLFNVTVLWSNAEVRRKEGLSTGLHPSSYPPSRVAIESERRQGAFGAAPRANVHEDDGDMLLGMDEHFELEWIVGSEEEGLVFKGGFWGMEGTDAQEPVGMGKDSAEVWFARRK
ncbi:hypothetical protein AN958_10520 [Leucoagaricus sp. SymC.cos]|nr:hypothetical protein AN958_10520 [Leucoagaricus sp. SymC.cos]